MIKNPMPQQVYRHFKGNLYQIISLAEHTETGERLVIYQALYGEFKIYARPLSIFQEKVDRVKYPEAKQEYRFELWNGSADAVRVEPESMKEEIQAANCLPGKEPETGRYMDETLGQKPETEQYLGEALGQEMEIRQCLDEIPEQKSETRRYLEETAEQKTETKQHTEETSEQELNMDPLVIDFLDAGTYKERLDILAALHHRITDDMINIMAIAVDVEVNEGELEDRYVELRSCLQFFDKFECSRLR